MVNSTVRMAAKEIALSSIGLRSLRAGLGLLCIADCLFRLPTATLLLSDYGVLPRPIYYNLFDSSWQWSLYLLSGRPFFVLSLLVVTTFLGVLNVAQRSTRFTRTALWMLVYSLQMRNPAVLDSTDTLLRLMLFWDIFLPDAVEESGLLACSATVALQVQLSTTLVMTALSLDPLSLALSLQWQGDSSHCPEWFAHVLTGSYLFAAAGLWFRRSRKLVLGLLSPVLVAQAVLMHPAFPLTLLVGLSALLEWGPQHSSDFKFESKFVAVGVLALLALSIVEVKRPTRLGAALGLAQNWQELYPYAQASLVEVVAKSGNQTVWTLTRDSDRRLRSYAQQVKNNSLWGLNLPNALGHELALPAHPTLYLGITEVRPGEYGEFKVLKI